MLLEYFTAILGVCIGYIAAGIQSGHELGLIFQATMNGRNILFQVLIATEFDIRAINRTAVGDAGVGQFGLVGQ